MAKKKEEEIIFLRLSENPLYRCNSLPYLDELHPYNVRVCISEHIYAGFSDANYIKYTDHNVYPDYFENIIIDKNNDMHEIIELLEEKSNKCFPGIILDSYKKTIDALKKRKSTLQI